MSTAEATKTDALAAWEKAKRHLDVSAGCLAYDVTIRADDPEGRATSHDKASSALTARLKADYVAAHAAERAAWSRVLDAVADRL